MLSNKIRPWKCVLTNFQSIFLKKHISTLVLALNQHFAPEPFVWDDRCSNQLIVIKSHHYKQTDLMYCAFEIERLAWWDLMWCDVMGFYRALNQRPYSKQQTYVYQLKWNDTASQSNSKSYFRKKYSLMTNPLNYESKHFSNFLSVWYL